MSITLYSKFRRQGLKRAWHFSGMTKWAINFAVDLAIASTVVLILLAILGMIDDWSNDKARPHVEKISQLESTWLSCLNNKGVWIDDRLHVCNIADTHFRQGDFK